ncbi:type II toxin-antitoxin system RelB family antitoxin [Massilia sp. SM-13]|uniref:type II toxin-antitoxin system RelB family antitoxin n=1 Tax=Pseudoduganella rhizocola TaxID=3382643 RepID=UPI0038B64143
MSDMPSPNATEFATAEEAEAYDRWFRAKVKAALGSQDATFSHEEVMAELRKVLEAKRATDAPDPLAR